MRLSVIFLVITLSIVIGAECADSSNGEDVTREESSSKDGSSSNEGSSSNDVSSANDGSSSSEGSSSKEGSSLSEDSSSSEGSSSNEGSSSDEGSSPNEGSRSNQENSSKKTNSLEYPSDSENNRILSTPEECARTCVIGEKPKTCYYHFTVENYATLTRACETCRRNSTSRLTADCQCITADGYELSGIKVANRMYPGPSIMVCLNDYVVIDVDNRIHGNGITLHWHGIFQNGYQYYDGVPYVTQCPIQEGTTFRYQWRAKNSGTHFWHSHTGLQKGEGLEGALIVREPKINEPNNEVWDHDEIENVIFLTDWFHDSPESHFPGNLVRNTRQLPDNFLINGMGQWTDPANGKTTTSPLATFTVKQGRRYRFRMINSCSLTCPVQMTIQGHNLTVIASDGEPVIPVNVDSITSFSAERYDFVLNTNQAPGNYWIQLRGLAECAPAKVQQLAILRYETAIYSEPHLERPSYETGLEAGIVLNQINTRCDGSASAKNFVCVSQLESAKPVPSRILAREPDITLFVPFGFHSYDIDDVFKPGTYKEFIVPTGEDEVVSLIGNNLTNVSPPSALISQRHEISNEQFCTLEDLPRRCYGSTTCQCSVLEKIPLDAVVELILVDEAPFEGLSHPFHLHGASFYVVGEGYSDDYNITKIDVTAARELHRNGMMRRRLRRPPAKDTYAVNNNGFTIIRFLANNPGYWLFHCHFLYHLAVGMAAVFQVGEASDLPPIPEGFPVCGNFLPPIYN